MITVRDIEQFLYDWAPPETAESWDNSCSALPSFVSNILCSR